MHSTTLTDAIRDHHREPAFETISKRALASIIERNAREQLPQRKRKSEALCPQCRMILSRQAQSCFC